MSPGPPPFAPPSGTPRPVAPPPHPPSSRSPKLTPATAAGQVVAFLVCALAAGLLAAWLGHPIVFVGSVSALGVGVIVGLTTPIGRRFTVVAGWVVAAAATLATILAVGLLEAYGHVDVPFAISPLVGLFVVGLDWCYVSRLRGAVVLSGVLVVPLLAAGKGWETAAAFAWFGGALLAFWFLERDARGSVPAPEPIVGGEAPRRPTSLVDLLGVIGPALLIGLLAAMLIGNPSCSSPTGSTDLGPSFSTGQRSAGDPSGQSSGQQSGSGGSSRSSTQAGGSTDAAGEPPTGDPAPLFRLDRNGREQTVDGYESGGGTISGADGQQYTVSTEGGQTVVRDAGGNVVARLDGDEVVASSADGDSQHFQIDELGQVFVRGADGTRYVLEERDGQVVLVGPDGEIVASGPLSADHLYALDPDGDALIPGSGADGAVPIPDQAVREGLLGQGKRYGDQAGDPTVTGSDGSTRVYGTDAEGRPQVRVDDGHGTVRTYVYDQSDGKLLVLELDEDGNVLRRYRVDPEGTYVEGRTASGSGSGSGSSATPEAASGRAGAPTEVGSDRGPDWWLIIGLAVAVAAFVAAVAWWLRRAKPPTAPTWAEALVRRIDREGELRGRPRRRGETIVAYTSSLAEGGPDEGELPDERLTAIGRVASDALFGRHEPSDELRDWVDEALSEIVAAHPVPHWTDRFRRDAARSAAT